MLTAEDSEFQDECIGVRDLAPQVQEGLRPRALCRNALQDAIRERGRRGTKVSGRAETSLE
jgi:hypothetical protein